MLKPLRLFCEHCDKYVPSDMPWQCSHCNFENDRTRYYSFLNKCQECKRPPKSYVCPHCGTVNFLDKDQDSAHPARKSTRCVLPEPVIDLREEKQRQHEDQKQDLVREIEITKLNARLAQLKASPEFQKELNAREKLEKSFSEHDAHVMGVYMIEKEQRAKHAERHKDDPEMLEKANESLGMWVEKQL
ncbi:MAG TPA: zinc ribbon domain-containing protein [Opitutus sp.]|nr:zinc ribbon domain-containing protein [Opitutus sp.]